MFTRSSLIIAIIAISIFGLAVSTFGRQFDNARRGNSGPSWPYHPNRPGVEAYMQGGAFVATTGSVTSMLFNPAGLARIPGRLVAMVESGWASETEFLRFFNFTFGSGFQPVQFAGLAFKLERKLTIGAYYAHPTHYDLDMGPIQIATIDHPDGTGEFFEPVLKRTQTSLGLSLAAVLGEQFYLGGSVEWRRASVKDEIWHEIAEGDADAAQFAFGTILKVNEWSLGLSTQSKHKATGDLRFSPSTPLVSVDLPPDLRGNNDPIIIRTETFRFSVEEPLALRLGIATPDILGRLRLSADAEYKDFGSDTPIERWQFYSGGMLKLLSNFHLGFGAFTFRKDYSAYVDGPDSENFWTVGGVIELAQFRFSASFMDGDLLTENFKGQQFVNFAVGYVIP